MRRMRDCLLSIGLFDLPSHGPLYTWTNKRLADPVGKKLDRCLVNDQWLLIFSASHCSFEAPDFSDHTPCHIRLFSEPPSFGTRPFKFLNCLTKLPSFLDTVSSAWSEAGTVAVNCGDLCYKLRRIKKDLKALSRENYSNIVKRVAEASDVLASMQLALLNDPSVVNLTWEKSAMSIWIALREAEESFFKQRSRVKWLAEGDSNTTFYHNYTKIRNATNAIKHILKADDSTTSSLQEVHEVAVDHFSSFMNTFRGVFCPALPDFLNDLQPCRLSESQAACLISPISSELIKDTLFHMPLGKTPGPDGLPAEFFRATWGAESITEFRPTACLNTTYKIISRILADRLKQHLPQLITPNQTAFVKDRLLLENVLLASEVLLGYHKASSPPRITLKVDISKAFNSVRWDIVLSVLQELGVPVAFIQWIRACICSASFSININGVTSGFFKSKSGLR
ncbi:uncharacterized protein LOC112089192 [Eutrema salsugineum]|uniref:uncharacterized protein LOC112089192 n=1 Tax=Eutrema salsugineum TaxID=72664 RepID=UPI000CED47D8|nr:uncharacterized protein LOC112089192 [Eutrema salsugineum]